MHLSALATAGIADLIARYRSAHATHHFVENAILLVGSVAATCCANVVVPLYFHHNMVLQRECRVPVWGNASTGERVTVRFAGQTKTATAGSAGTWRVELDPMPASVEPRQMTIAGANTIALNNVVVGDVWLCNGQSNMEYKFMWITNTYYDDSLTSANYPLLRYTDVTFDWRWTACTPASVDSFAVVAYFFGRDILLSLDQRVPIGLIDASAGGTRIEQWMKSQNGDMYRTYLAPMVGYALRGAAWYQGEANDVNAAQYRDLLSAMIREWRTEWGQGDFPFLIVQLPNFGALQTVPAESASTWSLIREAQMLNLAEPNAGMAITIDMAVDDAWDIHPLRKWMAGRRLALWARHSVYGQTGFTFSGPVFRSMRVAGNRAFLRFYHTGGSLVARGNQLNGFAICGADSQFVWAQASISGDSVEVTSPSVTSPVAIRYSWAMNPVGNLYNSAGLPASPFRTDGPQLPLGILDEVPTGVHESPPAVRELSHRAASGPWTQETFVLVDFRGRCVFRGSADTTPSAPGRTVGAGVYLVGCREEAPHSAVRTVIGQLP